MIAESTGKEVFDYRVPEAYWIGNGLLDKVRLKDFYLFSHSTLKGRDKNAVKKAFSIPGIKIVPHHTLYVLMTLSLPIVKGGPNLSNEEKVIGQMDSCRISWGTVKEVDKNELAVLRRPLLKSGESISLGEEVISRIKYEPSIDSMKNVKRGDHVSIHWDFACERLNESQLKNIEKYTLSDLDTINAMIKRLKKMF